MSIFPTIDVGCTTRRRTRDANHVYIYNSYYYRVEKKNRKMYIIFFCFLSRNLLTDRVIVPNNNDNNGFWRSDETGTRIIIIIVLCTRKNNIIGTPAVTKTAERYRVGAHRGDGAGGRLNVTVTH